MTKQTGMPFAANYTETFTNSMKAGPKTIARGRPP